MNQISDIMSLVIRHYPTEVAQHSHFHHQVVLPLRGKLDIEIEQCIGQVKDGVGAFIEAGDVHHFSAKGENEFIVLDLPSDTSKRLKKSIKPAFFSVGQDIQALVDYALAARKQGYFPQTMRWAWSSLLIQRLRAHGVVSHQGSDALDRAIAFMRTRLSNPISVNDIATTAGLSVSRLHAVFRDRLATTPHAYLMALRVEAAIDLLTTTRLAIADIALRTGYTDQSALTRTLRRAGNQAPGSLRQQYQPSGIKKA